MLQIRKSDRDNLGEIFLFTYAKSYVMTPLLDQSHPDNLNKGVTTYILIEE